MKSTMKRFLCLACAVTVGMTTMASCQKNPSSEDTSSDEYEIEYVYESGSTGSKDDTASGTDSGSSTTSNKNPGTAASGSSSTGGGAETDLAKKYKGTTVSFAAWSDPAHPTEVFKSFEKKYGIKVEIMSVPQSTYINTIAGKIAAGTGPDVIFENAFFPSCLNVLQPITVADTIDLSDPIYDQEYIKHFTINGKVYEVSSISNYWTEGQIFLFNKSLFKKAGLSNMTPDKLYKQGKWNWETMESLMKTLSTKLEKGTYPLYVYPYAVSATAGAAFFYYDKGTQTIKSGIDDPILGQTLTKMSEWIEKGLATPKNMFVEGKVAMLFDGFWSLRTKGAHAAMKNKSDIGFTYVPDYDATHKGITRSGCSRGVGICKGSKNPGGAGLFIRHFLDVNNYDLDSAFISEEAKDFFFEVSSKPSKDMFIHTTQQVVGPINGANGDLYYNFEVKFKSNQIITELNKLKNVCNSYADKANKLIQDNTK